MKKKCLLVIAMIITSILMLNVVGYLAAFHAPIKTLAQYEDDHLGGLMHARLWLSKHQPEIVFLGDSRTKYHVDTRWLAQQGLRAYNAGISGQFIELWPSAVNQLASYHPKVIVLGLTMSDLYSPLYINSAKSIGIADIQMLIKTRQPMSVSKNAIKPLINASLPLTYLPRLIKERLFRASASKYNANWNCDVVKQYDYKKGQIALCDNGDGVMSSSIQENDFLKSLQMVKLGQPNRNTIRYLNEVIHMIEAQGIKPIVMFIPYFHKQFAFDPKVLQLLDCPVMDLSNYFIEDKYQSYWANGSHFNERGRAAYTSLVLKSLNSSLI